MPDPESLILSILDPDGRDNPHPAFAALRSSVPVYHHAGLDTYFLTRFADCHAVLTNSAFRVPDREWCSHAFPDWREHPAAEFFYSSLLRTNGAEHSRVRRLIGGGFGARRISALLPAVRGIVDELLDRFADATADGGPADFQELVGYPLPIAVVSHLIGVPPQERGDFDRLGHDAGRLLEPVRTQEDWRRADEAVVALRTYFADLVRRRRARPADDLTSTLLAVRDVDDGRLSADELVDTLLLVLVAGFETTAHLLGLAVHALLSHPEQWRLLAKRPGAAAGAVEETLRWDTPVRMTERIAARPVEVGGVPIPEGGNVTAVLTAGNRDPARHPDPDTFAVLRTDIKVLSFSAGPHYCLGAALARAEGAELLERIVSRFPRLAPAGEPVRRKSVSLRAFARLPLAAVG
ncbi:cytochrome P450 [Streptomyces sp. MP131-18]|uniref:cytochrome P450 n=1 Tax=Streptomyces sp. MP131-18 TaxID=1857892 RepID=UPI00097C2598|nr:cytochrome P450 [Streptomyces sp. MP131-18]ONK11692.1 6-deoxyerythronolide B hydroxylase [Streptomyces sp. MP131-18]